MAVVDSNGEDLIMRQLKPGSLRQGDSIFVASPASPASSREAFLRGKELIEQRGYRVIEGARLSDRHLLFAGTAQARAEELNGAFLDPAIRAIVCGQGGCGTAQVLPFLDFAAVAANPKIIIGYSDITSLHLALNRRTGLVTFHGPMVTSDLGRRFGVKSLDHLLKMVTTGSGSLEIDMRGRAFSTIVPGIAAGRLTGGCLSVVAASLGTDFEIDTAGAILFLEDIDEQPHRVDRYLTQLLQAGKLDRVRGILFGAFRLCRYRKGDGYARYGVTLLDLIRERIAPLNLPAVYGVPFGHIAPALTIPLGARAMLDATEGRLVIEPAVR
jgi:muramoyltetrapeptide carboxypeptidase